MNLPTGKKKLAIISGAIVLVILAALIILAAQSNRIVKAKLEQALGDNFKVERISLGWGSVAVYQPVFLRDGQTVASAKSIILKADFLGLLKSGISLSSVILEEPLVKLEVNPDGAWILPVAVEKKQPEAPPAPKPGPFYIGEIKITEGTLVYRDHRLQGPDGVEVQKINLQIASISIPSKNEVSKFTLQFQPAGKLISGLLFLSGTINFETMAVDVQCAGQNLTLLDAGAAGPAFRSQGIGFTATSEGLPAKPLILSDLLLTKPHVRLETDRKGTIMNPLSAVMPKEAGPRKQAAPMRVEVKNLKVTEGELLYLDGKIARPPHPIRLTDISLHADKLSFPLASQSTTYEFSGRIPGNRGTGTLTSSGKADLKTIDTNSKIALRNLDLTSLKPYLLKKGDVDISRGFLDLDADLNIRQKAIHAPVHSVIKNLEWVKGSGLKDKFLGIPRALVVEALETNNDEIAFDFILEGSLENPKFNFQENLVRRLTAGLAKTLGLSVIEAGETLIIQGSRAVKGIGEGLQETEKELKKLFK